MYAQIIDNAIGQTGGLPDSARRVDSGAWVLGLADADQATREACGWFEVDDTARPDDTATTTHDQLIELVAGVPTVVWTERAKTAEELNPPVSDSEKLATLLAALTDAQSLEEIRDAAAAAGGN
jgi:hypothetical protein